MRRFASFVLALLFALSSPAYALGQSLNGATAVSAIELAISGQRLIHVGGALKLNATLTNRSAAPIAISFVHDGWADSNFNWSITDSSDRVLPPPFGGPQYAVCLLSGPAPEERIHVLQPAEKYKFTSDPSEGFAFHGKGFYKVTLRYQFDPAMVVTAAQMPKEDWGAPGTPASYPKREILLNTPKIDVSSNVWTVYLTD